MKKDKITIESLTQSQIWQPRVQLRFVKRDVQPDNIHLLPSKTEKILQQLFTSNLGNQEWRDIPIEMES